MKNAVFINAFFRKRIIAYCCYLGYYCIQILSISDFFICWVLWSKVTITLRLIQNWDPWWVENWRNSYDTTIYEILVLIKTSFLNLFYYVFSFRTICIVYTGKLRESSTMAQIIILKRGYCIHTHWKKNDITWSNVFMPNWMSFLLLV